MSSGDDVFPDDRVISIGEAATSPEITTAKEYTYKVIVSGTYIKTYRREPEWPSALALPELTPQFLSENLVTLPASSIIDAELVERNTGHEFDELELDIRVELGFTATDTVTAKEGHDFFHDEYFEALIRDEDIDPDSIQTLDISIKRQGG